MMLAKALASASASAQKVYVEDVFSTWLYTGNGSTQTITNGIDLSGKGGLVWIKRRDLAGSNYLFDSGQSAFAAYLVSNNTSSAASFTPPNWITASTTGFDINPNWGTALNGSGQSMASWTFRKQAKFFDVVSYTGSGANRTIAHSLGSVPGTIIVKRTDTTGDWQVYHRSLANTEYMVLNSTAAKATGATRWNSTTPTSTVFSLGTDATVNASGGTYVAYLFAHDAGGFGASGNESVVKCGSFTTNASGYIPEVDLGWEPQFLLYKASSTTGNWEIADTMRRWNASLGSDGGNYNSLYPNLSNAEAAGAVGPVVKSTGFGSPGNLNFGANTTFIYIAIRRGPMKTPTDATKVFNATVDTSVSPTTTFGVGFPADSFWTGFRANAISPRAHARITGNGYLSTADTAAELTTTVGWDKQNSLTLATGNGLSLVDYFFRRAPGFFDAVAYTGTGVARTVSHNLGVAPEMMIIKTRSNTNNWPVYHSALGATKWCFLDDAGIELSTTFAWNSTAPTSTQFTTGTASAVNESGWTFIAYLFATCPGVSKVGSYTGTGTTLNVDCGFTAGARFVLIKRRNSTGDWYVWDTARGIVSGNDPYLLLNSTAAEVTNTDYIDPLSSGFQISSTAPAAINASGGTFVFLAIS